MAGLVDEVKARAPKLRGRLAAAAAIAEATWFRVGGPAEALFSPADEDDLAYLLSALPRGILITTIGLGSNLIVRDGGLPGLVIRLGGRAFGSVEILEGFRVAVGAATPDQYVAKAAA
ncbi:MAG: UDP-N-acetylenolpyruvoylglucosamine reductase, partial [Hyphomicrobiales bacterium]|nr:UDP-N-acetylenolpyruvoylglucosamine reductase [Hyphomicrobiales bacterium]